jgi:DinB superfamily
MSTKVAKAFCDEISELREMLDEVPSDLASVPWRAGGWTRKEILGHLLDSAANNRQRFVRAAIDGTYTGPGYAQDAWVNMHGYVHLSWKTLVQWWRVEHDILLAVVERIPEERFSAMCTVGGDAPVTLRFLIEDYTRHQFHHFEQLNAPLSGT